MVVSGTSRYVTRRSVLSGVAATVVGGTAGCLGSGTETVRVLSAGSLARTFEDHVGPAFEDDTGTRIHGEYYGSNALVRMVEEGTKRPDVIVSADATLLREQLYDEFTDWDVEFAGNCLGLGYDADTELGRHLEAGEPWYEHTREADAGDVAIGDPDLDPLGYRAVQAFELAAREHGLDGFREEMERLVYEEPDEPQLLAGVETGSRAAAVVYRNMALDHDLSFVEFPDAYNFSRPALADHYATVEYTTDDGYTAAGRPILYNATVSTEAANPDAGRRLVQFLLDNPDPLVEAGLTVGEQLPRPSGDVPEAIDV